MATYLLLRNNKESGPHTASDLVKLGLKAYDLVWIEGKSAAWRYPSEIEELKPYAPVAEEQPFDRFFKRNTEEKKQIKEAQPTPIKQEPVVNNINEENNFKKEESLYAPIARAEEKCIPKRSVFVTLPGGQTLKSAPGQAEVQLVKKTTPPPLPVVHNDEPAISEIKYSQPLDEIKEMYVKTLQQRKSKIARKSFLIANLKRAAVIVGLICVGVLTGFIIQSKPAGKAEVSHQVIHSLPVVTGSVSNGVTENTIEQNKLQAADQMTLANRKQDIKASFDEPLRTEQAQPPVRIRKETMIKPSPKKEFDETQTPPSTETDAITGERIKKVRSDNTIDTGNKVVIKPKKTSLYDLVSVRSNDYKRVAFGGIRNLQLTVTNNSNFTLNNVIVELQYLKPSEEPLRTENIRFHSIAPNGTSTIRVPDTNRGIKVIFKIVSLESKQSGDDVAGR